jgi:hypothetical protein
MVILYTGLYNDWKLFFAERSLLPEEFRNDGYYTLAFQRWCGFEERIGSIVRLNFVGELKIAIVPFSKFCHSECESKNEVKDDAQVNVLERKKEKSKTDRSQQVVPA